ncbi:hypothetical protein ACFL6U_16285 [Planctomycetota bacterium]
MIFQLMLFHTSDESELQRLVDEIGRWFHSEEIRCKTSDLSKSYKDYLIWQWFIRDLPHRNRIENLYRHLVRFSEKQRILIAIRGYEDHGSGQIPHQTTSGILVDGKVAQLWNVVEAGWHRISSSDDHLWFYCEPNMEPESESSKVAVEKLQEMRNIPDNENEEFRRQEITIQVPPGVSLESLAEVAYRDVLATSAEEKGVGGRNALLIISIEHSTHPRHRLSKDHDSRQEQFTFMNSAACGLQYVPPKKGGNTIVDCLMDGKVTLLKAIAEPERE